MSNNSLKNKSYLSLILFFNEDEEEFALRFPANKLDVKESVIKEHALKKLKTEHPCIMERMALEKDICVEIIGKLEANIKYKPEDCPEVCEVYLLPDCEYFMLVA